MAPLIAPPTTGVVPPPSTLSPGDIRALEQLRQRLFQLTNSLSTLQNSLQSSDPLPSWPSIQSLSAIIAQNLTSITIHLTTNHAFLSKTVAHPHPSFPAAHEDLLSYLLRTKLDPPVADAFAAAQTDAGTFFGTNDEVAGDRELRSGKEEEQVVRRLWEWAAVRVNEEARSRDWEGEFTKEERDGGVDNVDTGLRRRLRDDDDEDDEEDEDEEMGDGEGEKQTQETIQPLPMETWLRFMTTGKTPN